MTPLVRWPLVRWLAVAFVCWAAERLGLALEDIDLDDEGGAA